jgi:C4-dicarboxylate-specific signal transduction histidine kinase
MAQRHASILGRLVNGVAHELNTPLGVQIAACDGLNMLLEDREQISTAVDDIVETVQLVAQQAKRSANIVRRLKQISAASVSTPAQPTPMVEELRLILDSLPMVADTPLLEVVGSETAVCLLDRNALHAVVNELLDNIRVHAKVGEESPCGTITVASVGKNVEVTVSDNGPGIPADALARYFDPFFTTRQSQGHLGIGGYIVQNLVRDALNGSVRVDGSTERGGASVTLVFPGT